MSFRITQCPACESTFSTSPRVLESAAGKVRCGACLTIFEAAENFLATDFDAEAENESVFVGSSAREFFDPSSFFTRQSLRESVSDNGSQAMPENPEWPVLETQPEPRLDMEDPRTPDYLALDGAELADYAAGDAEQATGVMPEDDEFLALVADAQSRPADSPPEAPAFEALAAGGYPALDEVITALLAEDNESPANPVTDTPTVELLAAGGYPALEEVIDELLAEPETPPGAGVTDEASKPDVQLDGTPGVEEPGSLPLFPDESAAPDTHTDRSQPELPGSPPEAFQLHVQFSLAPGSNGAPVESRKKPEPPPASSADLTDEIVGEFNAAINEADFQQTLASDMDAVASEKPDVELDPYHEADADEARDGVVPEAEPGESRLEPDQSVAAIRARALQSDLQDEDGLEAIPQENLESLGDFSSPVEILTRRQRRLGRQLAWATVALVAAIMLAGQYLWQELERYAQVASVRPVYEWVCDLAGCDLPVYNNIDAIESSNLSVRSHPEQDNALSVSVEFRNAASFAQRFPIMVLSFNSTNNNVIALREFAPNEYLPPALRARSLLPPQTAVQVNLELMDPGEDAINYTLAFRRP